MTENQTLQALADRQAITDLIHRYCRAVDRIDPELGYSIWHEGAVAEYGDAIYNGTGRGVIDYICASHKHALCHFHSVTNILIELNGDRAGSETYFTMNMRMQQDGKLIAIQMWGRYIDQWSRRNGRWGIDKRVVLRDCDEIRHDVTPFQEAAVNGRRDRTDASYHVLSAAN